VEQMVFVLCQVLHLLNQTGLNWRRRYVPFITRALDSWTLFLCGLCARENATQPASRSWNFGLFRLSAGFYLLSDEPSVFRDIQFYRMIFSLIFSIYDGHNLV
jgi:hypothetical protein